jgi:hypothetical protein
MDCAGKRVTNKRMSLKASILNRLPAMVDWMLWPFWVTFQAEHRELAAFGPPYISDWVRAA